MREMMFFDNRISDRQSERYHSDVPAADQTHWKGVGE